MTDWLAIAMAAVSILTPFAKKAGEKAAEKVGEALFDLVKRKFKGDREAESTLKNFKKNPDRHSAALTDILREEAEADPEFGAALKRLVDAADQQAIGKVTQVAQGTGIAQAAGSGASASVSMSKKDN